MRHFLCTTCLLALSGCATLSFAPPQVRTDRELVVTNSESFTNAKCTPDQFAKRARDIGENVEGAQLLISNYILVYDCQADRAAEGRQFFEVPGFLVAAGAATAAAFGAGPGVAIGAGAAGIGLTQGNSYYAPKDKAVVFSDASKAFNCMAKAAIGIDTSTVKAISAAQAGSGSGGNTGSNVTESNAGDQAPKAGAFVTIPLEVKYYRIVQAGVREAVGYARDRLRSAGKPFDTAGLAAQMKLLVQQEQKTESKPPAQTGDEAKKAVVPTTTTATGTKGALMEILAPKTAAQRALEGMSDEQVGRAVIDVDLLEPRIGQCALLAKGSS
jgi:hypothetical protein